MPHETSFATFLSMQVAKFEALTFKRNTPAKLNEIWKQQFKFKVKDSFRAK